MALKAFNWTLRNSWLRFSRKQFSTQKHEYQIPETYRNSFYLANASLLDYTNWFVHNALRVIYSDLITDLQTEGCDVKEAVNKINSVIKIVEPCSHFIDVQFPVQMTNGLYEVFRGFRAEHGVHITNRPCLGGFRLCSKIQKSDIKALASISTYKYACMGIDMVGAHGGIVLSRESLEEEDLQRVIQAYIKEIIKKKFFGEAIDVFEPDVNCGSKEMTWILAANSKLKGGTGNACAVGKPSMFGGIHDREKAVAQGILFGLDVFLQNKEIMKSVELDVGWSNKTFILQGLGNVGTHTALFLENVGVKCVGIVESDCHIYDDKGINIQEAIMYKNRKGTLKGFTLLIKYDEPNKVLSSTCDILILSATEKSLVYYVADNVRAKIVVEAANAPMTPSVHKVLVGHNKLVLPDIYINSGSSIASYFEYLKNIQHVPLTNIEGSTNGLFIDALNTNQMPTKYTALRNASGSNVLRPKIISGHSEKNVVAEVIENIMLQTAELIQCYIQISNRCKDPEKDPYIGEYYMLKEGVALDIDKVIKNPRLRLLVKVNVEFILRRMLWYQGSQYIYEGPTDKRYIIPGFGYICIEPTKTKFTPVLYTTMVEANDPYTLLYFNKI